MLLSSVFKVIMRTYNSVFVILNVDAPALSVEFNSIYNFVFIKGNSNDLKKDEIYFKETITRAFFQTAFPPTTAVPSLFKLFGHLTNLICI